jgi:predicted hotdog family 3-hydroxylacyl-ACP dehydratase
VSLIPDPMNCELLDRDLILSLIPHQGSMCLHDEVLDWDAERLRLRSAGHRSPAHPLRSCDRLHAVHLCEYGAQAMAVHGGLLARASGQVAAPGLLVSLRQVVLHCARIDLLQDDLITHAERLLDNGSSWQYAFRVEHRAQCLASGRAAVMLRPQEM